MPYRKSIATLYVEQTTGPDGLTQDEAAARLIRFGPNQLAGKAPISPLVIFLNQFKNFIVYILLFAVVFAVAVGEWVDSLIILAILLLNAFIGFFQELSANRSLEALKKLAAVKATVVRGGIRQVIDANLLVPGDIVQLEAGDKVPADCRIIAVVRLKVEEASLTGESVPADKDAGVLDREVPLGDRGNMLFSSTAVVTGNARAVVVATGMATEIGRITTLLQDTGEEMTPLQQRLDVFGKRLGLAILGICLVVFAMLATKAVLAGEVTLATFIPFAFIAISLAVAAVPTALPAVVTIALSVGVKRLLARKALVRQLSSVETLGSCDVICTDKTGTLTQNRMSVRHAWTMNHEAELDGDGYHPTGTVSGTIDPVLFACGVLCNNASLYEEEGEWRITGDPTEAAILVSARRAGVHHHGRRLDELPFDSERKMMSVLVEDDDGPVIFVKGGPDQLLGRCSRVLVDGVDVPLDDRLRARIHQQNDAYASRAMRVLAFAFRPLGEGRDFDEQDLIFIGLQAMSDPPRADVIAAVKRTGEAGIRVIMITGDHPETAAAVGAEIGIVGGALTGAEVEAIPEDELIGHLARGVNIFARVAPEHKQRIVTALQKMGHTVAMTGDGVNDAPALKKADIGVAVGSGTEVAKEASDFVLLDDSFTHIVNAIEEGRGIYDNIQKSIMLLLSGNVGEVLIIFLAVLLGLNLPLTAVLLLWINMVTDGAPALAFSVDPYGKGIMRRKPKPRNEAILPADKLAVIVVLGAVGTAIALWLFAKNGGSGGTEAELRHAQTMVFNFVVLYEVVLVFIIRQQYRVPFFSNVWVWGAVLSMVLLQAGLMYSPLAGLFQIVPLGKADLFSLTLAGGVFYAVSLVYVFGADRWWRLRPRHRKVGRAA